MFTKDVKWWQFLS